MPRCIVVWGSDAWLCRYTDISVLGHVEARMCGCVDVYVCRREGVQVHLCMGDVGFPSVCCEYH